MDLMSILRNILRFQDFILITLIVQGYCDNQQDGILYPRESESREVKSLDGIWLFRAENRAENNLKPGSGFRKKWFSKPFQETGEFEFMPVPSSFNDISQDKNIRDHVGWVWYQKVFRVPNSRWVAEKLRVFLRFGSANYFAVVWLNGEHLMNHTGGYLPFQGEITQYLHLSKENYLVVALNNSLTPLTIPQGTLSYPSDRSRYPPGYTVQTYNFDYFNFAGIHRPVYIHTTPQFYIQDITITTGFIKIDNQLVGIVDYAIKYDKGLDKHKKQGNNLKNSIHSDHDQIKDFEYEVNVYVRNRKNIPIASGSGESGKITIPDCILWWPYLSNPPGETAGYLYTLEVHLIRKNGESENEDSEDVYRLKFGIRTIQFNSTSFQINEKPFYFHGFGRHEDYSIRGRGVDYVSLVNDHNLIMWTGANSYRTSHYPYAEEILDLTDELGIVIIDESPAIGLSGYNDTLRANHEQVMRDLVQRDKNRASVVMWSIGNEPKSREPNASLYFDKVINVTRKADPGHRPITIVLSAPFYQDKGPNLDVISINRYFGWYGDTGRLDVIGLQIPTEVKDWHKKYKKLIMITEYGAGTIAGMHSTPSFVWTEDYQVDYLREHFKAFDNLRKSLPYFIGEMIWNFADFATPQETFRPWGCMKGIFTRERQPKRAAHIVRYRYWKLANESMSLGEDRMPKDLLFYPFEAI